MPPRKFHPGIIGLRRKQIAIILKEASSDNSERKKMQFYRNKRRNECFLRIKENKDWREVG